MNMIHLTDKIYPIKELVVRLNYPGFHCWANAPDKHKYLSSLHRHVFYWEITAYVTDSDREHEFIDLKDKFLDILKNAWDYKTGREHRADDLEEYGYDMNNAFYFGSMSCEMIAEKTKGLIDSEIEIDISSVSVFEDNENGAKLTWA